MVVFIKTLTGKTFTIRVDPSSTVDMVKHEFAAIEGVPPDQQRLVFSGRQLHDGCVLSDYGVEEGATLYLVLRLCGQGHTSVVPRDRLFPMSFTALHSKSNYVQVVDALGSIPFTQNDAEIVLARPAIGDVFLRSEDKSPHRAFADAPPVDLTITLPNGGVVMAFYAFNRGSTAAEVMSLLMTVIGRRLPEELRESGFNTYVTRPSGAEVLLDDVSVLASPHNATRALRVEAVAPGAKPAFICPPNDDVASSSNESDV